MSDFGIICETNPMHNGHKYLIDRARALGADRVVCVMSGNTVQRGEFAIVDKYMRAEAILKCGADLVLELPFPWCSGSAEYFSMCGIEIARHFCDSLIFGSESGDVDLLRMAAQEASKEEFKKEYLQKLSEGIPATALYHDMLRNTVNEDFSSNDLLGIEYIRASLALKAELNFYTVTRKGDGYLSKEMPDDEFASAMAIRSMWNNGDFDHTKALIPKEAFEVYQKAYGEGTVYFESELDVFWLSFFRLHNGDDFSGVVGADGGLANRFCSMARKAHSTEELISLVKTKRYTDSNLRRTMLYCLAGVTKQDLETLPTETLLLAANARGRELMSEKRKACSFSVVTKPADMDPTARQNILSEKINSIYSLSRKSKADASIYMKMMPYIE